MSHPAPSWYPDPTGRHQHRWWDGTGWTEQVSDGGVHTIDHLENDGPVDVGANPHQVQQQVHGGGWSGAAVPRPVQGGGGSIFSEPILVVNQKAKLIEVTNQYAVFDQYGTQIASVSQVGQSAARKVLRVLTSLDQFLSHRLEIRDQHGQVQLLLTRPAKVFKSTIVVTGPDGAEIGRIVQENMIGKIRFDLQTADGQKVGAIKAENWRAWNFRIEDGAGSQVASITKTWEGLAKQVFTTADNYVVQLQGQIPQPLLSLVVASALSVDTALKQDARGLG